MQQPHEQQCDHGQHDLAVWTVSREKQIWIERDGEAGGALRARPREFEHARGQPDGCNQHQDIRQEAQQRIDDATRPIKKKNELRACRRVNRIENLI